MEAAPSSSARVVCPPRCWLDLKLDVLMQFLVEESLLVVRDMLALLLELEDIRQRLRVVILLDCGVNRVSHAVMWGRRC